MSSDDPASLRQTLENRKLGTSVPDIESPFSKCDCPWSRIRVNRIAIPDAKDRRKDPPLVYLEGSPTALREGSTFRLTRVVKIEPLQVTFRCGEEIRTFPCESCEPPRLTCSGMNTENGTAFFREVPSRRFRVGDMVMGATVVEISPDGVRLRFNGKEWTAPGVR